MEKPVRRPIVPPTKPINYWEMVKIYEQIIKKLSNVCLMNWHFAIFVPLNLVVESSVEIDEHHLQFCFIFTA